jgi:hypothetical protein
LFISFAFAAGWEGEYIWGSDDNAYICYEDGWIFGNLGWTNYIVAKVKSDGYSAEGKWFATGFKHGGPRDGVSSNKPSTGSVWVTREEDSNQLEVEYSYHGETKRYTWGIFDRKPGTKVDDRVSTCGIMDMSSNENLHGYWHEKGGEDSSNNYLWLCMDGSDYYGSYKYGWDTDDLSTGYLKGKCSYDGRVCRSEYYEKPEWGVQLDILLSDGYMKSMYWRGPTEEINDHTPHGHYLSTRKDDVAPNSKCSQYSERIVYPYQCPTFKTDDACAANWYYCNTRQTDGSCKRITWP